MPNNTFNKILLLKNFIKCKDVYDVSLHINPLIDIVIMIISDLDPLTEASLEYYESENINVILLLINRNDNLSLKILHKYTFLKGINVLSSFLKIKNEHYFLENIIQNDIMYISSDLKNLLLIKDTNNNNIDDNIQLLTNREVEVYNLISEPNAIIAERLDITLTTIKKHISSILKKTNSKNRVELLSKIKKKNI